MAKTDFSSCGKMHAHTWVSLRQPLRCGLTILVCSCVMLGAVQCQARGRQEQDVAEAARQERARKEHARKSHVYTDEDLKRAKILTPEDDERVSATRKQTPPALGEPMQPSLDAGLQMPELPLGNIARRYRNAKQILQDTAPFHLPFDEPAFAAPIVELPIVPAPLPVFNASRPRVVAAQPKKAQAPVVTNTPPAAALRRVDPFAPRMAPTAPRPSLHGEAVAPHVPSAGARVAPSAPRVVGVVPGGGSGDELKLPKIEPSAPKRTFHVAPATPHVPQAGTPYSATAPHAQGIVPGAQLTLPSMEPAAPKVRPHITEVAPHVQVYVQHAPPIAPRVDSMLPDGGAQLVLPGIAPAKPTMHLAPVKPHVPAVVSGRAPIPPRLDGGFSGMSGVRPRAGANSVESHAVAPPAAITPATPVINVSGTLHSVVVRPGDSLWKIALKNLGRGSRWQELVAANPAIVDPTRLEVGTSVVVPNETVAVKAQRKSVVVWRGDSLTRIAQANYGRASAWSCVAEANTEIKDPNRIYIGQTLNLPDTCKQ